jgi:nicotinamidase-related amidase
MNPLDINRTALLAMDFQNDIVPRLGDRGPALIERAAGVLGAARRSKLTVIHVAVSFRPGYPELNPHNAVFAQVAQTGRFAVTPPGSDIVPALKPEGGEAVIAKHRVGAFLGTDLDMILRAKQCETLLLMGIATSGVVLSTVRFAADSDYRLVVVKDCCGDADEEVHRVLTEKVYPRQAAVVTARELLAALPG